MTAIKSPSAISYFVPLSNQHRGLKNFKKLTISHKVTTIVLTALATLFTLPFLGVGGLVAFRFLSRKFSMQNPKNEIKPNPENSVTILFVRHGETAWNVQHRIQGQSNIPLNKTGLKQAEATANFLVKEHPDICAIYSSDLDRAFATAEATAKKFNLIPTKHAGFQELKYGEAEGLTVKERDRRYKKQADEIKSRISDGTQRWKVNVVPGAESDCQLVKRMKETLTAIVSQHQQGQKIAIFSHGHSIRELIHDATNTEDQHPLPNCAIAHFEYSSSEQRPLKFLRLIKNKL